MSNRDDPPLERQESHFTGTQVRRWRTIRPSSPHVVMGMAPVAAHRAALLPVDQLSASALVVQTTAN